MRRRGRRRRRRRRPGRDRARDRGRARPAPAPSAPARRRGRGRCRRGRRADPRRPRPGSRRRRRARRRSARDAVTIPPCSGWTRKSPGARPLADGVAVARRRNRSARSRPRSRCREGRAGSSPDLRGRRRATRRATSGSSARPRPRPAAWRSSRSVPNASAACVQRIFASAARHKASARPARRARRGGRDRACRHSSAARSADSGAGRPRRLPVRAPLPATPRRRGDSPRSAAAGRDRTRPDESPTRPSCAASTDSPARTQRRRRSRASTSRQRLWKSSSSGSGVRIAIRAALIPRAGSPAPRGSARRCRS